jgi:hypothetical protein
MRSCLLCCCRSPTASGPRPRFEPNADSAKKEASVVFRTLNSQGGYLLTENLPSSTSDAEQVSQEHTCDLHITSRNTDHPQALLALAVSAKTSQTPLGTSRIPAANRSEDSHCIPEAVMYGIYRPVATSVSNTCMCSQSQKVSL